MLRLLIENTMQFIVVIVINRYNVYLITLIKNKQNTLGVKHEWF